MFLRSVNISEPPSAVRIPLARNLGSPADVFEAKRSTCGVPHFLHRSPKYSHLRVHPTEEPKQRERAFAHSLSSFGRCLADREMRRVSARANTCSDSDRRVPEREVGTLPGKAMDNRHMFRVETDRLVLQVSVFLKKVVGNQ